MLYAADKSNEAKATLIIEKFILNLVNEKNLKFNEKYININSKAV